MSSDLDLYFERLDILKGLDRQLSWAREDQERRLRGKWDYSKPSPRRTRVLYDTPRYHAMSSNTLFGNEDPYRTPIDIFTEARESAEAGMSSGDWVPPNWFQKKIIIQDGLKWHDSHLASVKKRRSELGDMANYWRHISVVASRSSTPEHSELFRRKYREIVAEGDEEADILLEEIRVALEAVIPQYNGPLRAFYSQGGMNATFALDFRWPIIANTSNSFLKELFGRFWKDGLVHPRRWDARDRSNVWAIPEGLEPSMINSHDVKYLLRGRGVNSLRRVELARLLHSKIPFLIRRLKRCLAFRLIEDARSGVSSDRRGESGEIRNVKGWARRLKKYPLIKELNDDKRNILVGIALRNMTFPGIHAMAVDPSLAPTIESIEEELVFWVRVELFLHLFDMRMCRWRYGIEHSREGWANYVSEQRKDRQNEVDGLNRAGVNQDFISAYTDFRIEKEEMLELNKRHPDLDFYDVPHLGFGWVLMLEDDITHTKSSKLHSQDVRSLFLEPGPRVGGLHIFRWPALCSGDGFLAEGRGDSLREYLWNLKREHRGIRPRLRITRKFNRERLKYGDAESYVARATEFLGIEEDLSAIQSPLERFDAILGPYIEIDNRVSGLVEDMMDMDNGYSDDTFHIVRDILDGEMGEEERQLLTALVEGQTPSGVEMNEGILYDWIENWELHKHPAALGEILNGADFEAVAVKHGLGNY